MGQIVEHVESKANTFVSSFWEAMRGSLKSQSTFMHGDTHLYEEADQANLVYS